MQLMQKINAVAMMLVTECVHSLDDLISTVRVSISVSTCKSLQATKFL